MTAVATVRHRHPVLHPPVRHPTVRSPTVRSPTVGLPVPGFRLPRLSLPWFALLRLCLPRLPLRPRDGGQAVRLPHAQRRASAGGGQGGAVGAERDRVHLPGKPAQHGQLRRGRGRTDGRPGLDGRGHDAGGGDGEQPGELR